MFQAESVRDAAFGCDWVGTPIRFQRCLMFIIATASKEFQLTAGKFVPVSNFTAINVCIYVCMLTCTYLCMYVFVDISGHSREHKRAAINILPSRLKHYSLREKKQYRNLIIQEILLLISIPVIQLICWFMKNKSQTWKMKLWNI
jgi:hypothetical protein